MEEKKNSSNAVHLAKLSFIFVLVHIVIVLFCFVLNLIERYVGSNNFIFTFLRPLFNIVGSMLLVGLLVVFIFGIISLVNLFRAKVKKRKPYLHASISLFYGIVIIGLVIGSVVNKDIEACAFGLEIRCRSNEHTLAISCSIYQLNYDLWPSKDSWCDQIRSENDLSNDVFLCPIDKIGPCSYAMNENVPADTKELPGDLVLLTAMLNLLTLKRYRNCGGRLKTKNPTY